MYSSVLYTVSESGRTGGERYAARRSEYIEIHVARRLWKAAVEYNVVTNNDIQDTSGIHAEYTTGPDTYKIRTTLVQNTHEDTCISMQVQNTPQIQSRYKQDTERYSANLCIY